ncbi:MAG: hypothetical protein LBJ47_01240 [Tannerella sp.]|jgi:chromosome segregation ATPase|nr:hypothetical protein [Tannerella sp.]
MNIKHIFGVSRKELRGTIDALNSKVEQLQYLNVNLVRRYEKMIKKIRKEHAGQLDGYEATLLAIREEHAGQLKNYEAALYAIREEYAAKLNICDKTLQAARDEHAEQLKNCEPKLRGEISQLNIRINGLMLQIKKMKQEKDRLNDDLKKTGNQLSHLQNSALMKLSEMRKP